MLVKSILEKIMLNETNRINNIAISSLIVKYCKFIKPWIITTEKTATATIILLHYIILLEDGINFIEMLAFFGNPRHLQLLLILLLLSL